MAIKLNDRFLGGFVGEHELSAMDDAVKAAHSKLWNKTGLGNDFLGWVDLPVD